MWTTCLSFAEVTPPYISPPPHLYCRAFDTPIVQGQLCVHHHLIFVRELHCSVMKTNPDVRFIVMGVEGDLEKDVVEQVCPFVEPLMLHFLLR